MRRDRHREIGQTYPGLNDRSGRVTEAGGIPVSGAPRHTELGRKMAERLGIVRRSPIEVPTPDPFTKEDLGDKDLPVYAYKRPILESVRDNLITLVVAETGAGKSTQVPQYLFEEGYSVVMTQPRRMAAQMLADRIDHEVVESLEKDGYGLVGYQTARNNTINDRTRISVVTDGLRLVQELNERDEVADEVLLIDEVHEWNTNMELLIALVKKMSSERPRLRVVIMSATIDADALARYFTIDDRRPPIIEVPGRNHEVEMTEAPQSDVVMQAVEQVGNEKTVLVFLPGLREIDDTIDQIHRELKKRDMHGVTVLPLHGDMSPSQQEAITRSYHGPKIICATNVAQTSITIPDVDVVVDSGLERRTAIDDDGTGSLELNHISRADCRQRAGRCGRTHDGLYILTRYVSSEARKKKQNDNNRSIFRHVGLDEPYNPKTRQGRLDYAVPEILRTNADRSTLAMASAGLDLKQLDLYHTIDSKVLKRSANLLRVLGAFDANNVITMRGMRMNTFPIRPQLARMLAYSEEQNFTHIEKSYVAAMVACVEAGGLPNYISGGKEWRSLRPSRTSDYVSQLNMFLAAQDVDSMGVVASMGMNTRNVVDARQTHSKLLRRLEVPYRPLSAVLDEDTIDRLSDAVVSGQVDFVYRLEGGEYRRTSEALGRSVTRRVLSDRSLVRGSHGYVVGTPFKIPAVDSRPEKHILQDVHATSPEQLGRVAASLCAWEDQSTVWRGGRPKVLQQLVFRETVPVNQWREIDAVWTPELRDIIITEAKQRPGPALRQLQDTKRQLEKLWHRDATVPLITQDSIDSTVRKLATRTVVSPGQLDDKLRTHMLDNGLTIDSYISPEDVDEIMSNSPDFYTWNGVELEVTYKSGQPHLRRATKELVIELLKHSDTLKLPDGRKILIRISKRSAPRTLWQLSQDRKRGKL